MLRPCRQNLTLIAVAFVVGILSGRVAVAQPIYIALKTAVDHLPEPVDGIITVTLASGAWIKLRAVDVDHDRTAAHTDRVIIKATTSTQMTTGAGRKYMNFTFGPTFVATAWYEDVDWDETRLLANRDGSGDFGPSFQFDTKGVDFGLWLRSFRSQVYKNWLIPFAAMSLHGHTVVRFTIHRDGAVTDLAILQPSAVDAFNRSAFNALKASNPTVPLPQEYPEEKMVMTVIFYYNESPPDGGAANGRGGFGNGGGLTSAVTDVPRFCCPEYLETLKRLVDSHWQQRQGQDGTSAVRFVVHRDGSVTDVTIEQGTNQDLNLASQRAVAETERLPPLPAAFLGEQLTVHLIFRYTR